MQIAVYEDLEYRIGQIHWVELSRTERKRAWIKQCLRVVKQLEAALSKLVDRQYARGKDGRYLQPTKIYLDGAASSLGGKAVDQPADLAAKRRIGRTRARRMSVHITQATKTSAAYVQTSGGPCEFASNVSGVPPKQFIQHMAGHVKISRRVRRVAFDSPSKQPRVREPQQATLRIRRMEVSKATELERLASITSRTEQHMKRQELRSQRRMHRLNTRKAWQRRQELNTNASDHLWELVQEVTSPRPVMEDLFAWPRLAQRQRERLADDVQAIVKGSRR